VLEEVLILGEIKFQDKYKQHGDLFLIGIEIVFNNNYYVAVGGIIQTQKVPIVILLQQD